MAKIKDELKFSNATIDKDQKKIIETTKDGVLVYDIDTVLENWYGREGISITFSQNIDIKPSSTEY